MMFQRLVIASMFSSSSALNISVDISSEPVAFSLFIDCIVFSTSSFRMLCPDVISNHGIGSQSSSYSSFIYSTYLLSISS